MRELKYRIIKRFDRNGDLEYKPQVKPLLWPWWVAANNGYWRSDEKKAKQDIAHHRKRKRKIQIIYEGDGKDLEFIESL